MTMAQGELFNGDEGTNELSSTDLHGQSQTKEAKYARAYRSDPKNKDRINSQKKRRRALKKESELGSVSSMFESAALPIKSEPQTVENVLSNSDKPSLSDLWGVSSWEYQCRGDLIRDSDLEPLRTTRKQSSLRIQKGKGLRGQIKKVGSWPQGEQSHTFKENSKDICNDRDFLSGMFNQLSKLDGGAFIRNFPASIALGYFAYEACKFVTEQTLPMYQSLKFPNPELACYGAISLAVGFSALSVISKSSLAKLFTAIIILYEVILVFAGSQANQSDLASQALRNNPVHYEGWQLNVTNPSTSNLSR